MMGKDSKGSHDVDWLEKRLEGVSASRLLDRDLDVSEIRRRLVVRQRVRRVVGGGTAVIAMVVTFFVVAYSRPRADVLDRGSLAEVETQVPVGADRQAVDSELEMERLIAEAEAARVRAEVFQANLSTWKREQEVRAQEITVAKLISAQAGQEYLMRLAESAQ